MRLPAAHKKLKRLLNITVWHDSAQLLAGRFLKLIFLEQQNNYMKIIILTVYLLAFLLAFSIETSAVDFTVNLTTDQHDASSGDGACAVAVGGCSLRAAVEQANSLAGNDRILFDLPPNSIVTLTPINGGEILISNNGTLEIIGTGADDLTIDGGAGMNRILYINLATVSITNLTLKGGNETAAGVGTGGAILVEGGALTLNRVHVTDNRAWSGGGGVAYKSGTHRIIDSTISNNYAVFAGGGFFVGSSTALFVVNSTISGNRTSISGGGGFHNQGATTLRSVTITNNIAYGSGGFWSQQGAVNIGNTIVAGNTATDLPSSDIDFNAVSTIVSAGSNLIGSNSSVETAFPAGNPNTNNDLVGTPSAPINPQLGSLALNGGPTLTHALLLGSPAIDIGINSLAVDPFINTFLAFDQRGTGFPRIVDADADGIATVDIGAFEVQQVIVPPTSIEQCKNGGWKRFTIPRRFKNQGDCIQYVNTGR